MASFLSLMIAKAKMKAAAKTPMTAPAMMESDISMMETTIMVSVPPSSME